LNAPQGSNAGSQTVPPVAAAPLVGAPGREIVRIERRMLPNGRQVELVVTAVTVLTVSGVYATHEEIAYPATDCGCAPHTIHDLYSCAKCRRTVCGRHVVTCQACGANACSCCSCATVINGSMVVICRECDKELNTPRWLKWLKQALGFGK
jgi:hypothetical protein